MGKPDIVRLKDELYKKLKTVDVKVLTLMKDSILGCEYFRNPVYLSCIKLQEHLDTLSLEEVESGMTLVDTFLKELELAVNNTSKGDRK